MKKRCFFVGALLIASMSAMLVSCDNNTPSNGCKCTEEAYGNENTFVISTTEMINAYGVQSCGALANLIQDQESQVAASIKVSCKGY